MADKRQHTSCASPVVREKLSPKRSRQSSSLLMDLPNELFMEVFSYLSHVDVVHAFSALNHRLQDLVNNYCFTFDFTSVAKAKLEHTIREHNTRLWRALGLSDNDQTPGQIAFFFEQYPFATHMSRLEVLSLTSMKSSFTQMIPPQLRACTQLVSLTLGTICGKQMPLLELPCLRKLVVTSCKYNRWMEVGAFLLHMTTVEQECSLCRICNNWKILSTLSCTTPSMRLILCGPFS